MKRPSEFVIKRVLNETATPEEAAQVAAWFATPEGQAWVSRSMDQDAEWLEAGVMQPLDSDSTERLLLRIERMIAQRRRRRLMLGIAAVLIPCALVLAAWFNLNSRLGGALFTAPTVEWTSAVRGERKELVFQDGTRVWLNAGSSISYPARFGLSERRVRLDGEAYFEVTPNARRPFIVEVDGAAAVRVLGTSFDVKAYASDPTVEVVLLEGSVEFSQDTFSYRLEPSQKLSFDKTSRRGVVTVLENAERSMLWSRNVICFRDAPMRQVIAELERWYDVRVEVADPKVYDLSFSFYTSNMPLSELLLELENIAPIRCDLANGVLRISMRRE